MMWSDNVAAVHDTDTLRQAQSMAASYKRAGGIVKKSILRDLIDLLSPPVSPDTPTPTG